MERATDGGPLPPGVPARPPRAMAWIVVAFLTATLLTVHARPLTKAAEARAWVVARTMATTGEFLVPAYQGEARLKKPPLQSWVQAGVMRALDLSSLWVAGLATALVGVLFALGPWLLGRALGAEAAGLVGGLLLAGSRATLTWGGSPEHDVPFAAWTGLAFAMLAKAVGPGGRAGHVAASGLACGLALLTKSPFAPAFVAGTALTLQLRARRCRPVPVAAWWGLFLAGLVLPIATWIVALAARLGSVGALFDEAWRQASGSGGAHTKPFLAGLVYPLGTLVKASLPWAPVVLGLAVVLVVRGRRDPVARAALAATPRFALVALAVCGVVLTLTPAKQEHYVLPALVPAALLAGHVLVAAAGALRRGPRLVGALVFGAAIAYAASRVIAARGDLGGVDLEAAFRFGPGLAFATVLLVVATPRLPAIAAAAVAGAFVLGVGNLADVARERAREDLRDAVFEASLRPEGAALLEQATPGPSRLPASRTLVGFEPGAGEAFDTLVAWQDSPFVRVRTLEALREHLERDPRCFVVVRATTGPSIEALRSRLRPLGVLSPRRPGSDRDRYLLFDGAR